MPGHRTLLAIFALLAACLGWAFSFPLLKGLLAHQRELTGHDSAWITNQALLLRYAGAALVLGVLACWRLRRMPNRPEWIQAAVCAVASGLGLFLQIDALAYCKASTVGFLTQFYVVVLPLVAALAQRRLPAVLTMLSVVLAFAGVAVLSGVSLHDLRPGRGELMTLGAALLFTVHILALGVRRWADNDGLQVTWAMFALMALATVPVVAFSGPGLTAIPACYPDAASVAILITVVLLCTCLAYALMTIWQRHVSSTQAGVIYCCEAVFTAVLCLFLPGLVSGWLSVSYADEVVTWNMLLGGGLVLGGCILVQFAPAPQASPGLR